MTNYFSSFNLNLAATTFVDLKIKSNVVTQQPINIHRSLNPFSKNAPLPNIFLLLYDYRRTICGTVSVS